MLLSSYISSLLDKSHLAFQLDFSVPVTLSSELLAASCIGNGSLVYKIY